MTNEPYLSIIIPIYNAETFIIDTLKKIIAWERNLPYSVEIILVNDGSVDSTLDIIHKILSSHSLNIHIISYERNRGKGYAVRKGMLKAQGKFRIFTDADIPYGLSIIDKILYYLDFKEFDVCIGNRTSDQSIYSQEISKIRRFTSRIFTLIISRYVVTGVKDTQCGLKGFRGEIAEKLFKELNVKGFAFDVETLYYCFKYDFEIKRIPVIFQGNSISTIRLPIVSIKMIWDIICLPFRFHFKKGKSK